MDEQIEVWNIFHDGTIVEVRGELPNISLRIEIPYLREMFPGAGHSFWAHIVDCKTCQYSNWRGKEITVLAEIMGEEPEILDVSQIGNMAHIVCVNGSLDLKYAEISFELDSGVPVSINELDKVCRTYWDEWGKRSKRT